MILAKIIADTVSPDGIRITSFQLEYQRFIHSEFMTHRMFSRNASSSRAIPTRKMLDRIRHDPARPFHWGKNQPGMQAREELPSAFSEWIEAAKSSIEHAEILHEIGYHKQIVNRITEPFQWISVVCTATEWSNFFNLRLHEDAQPEIRILAEKMAESFRNSRPVGKNWHLPYVTLEEQMNNGVETSLKASVARCARVSYLNHDDSAPDLEKDEKLFYRLYESGHMSPFEHQAQWSDAGHTHKTFDGTLWSANFRGWSQYRQIIEKLGLK